MSSDFIILAILKSPSSMLDFTPELQICEIQTTTERSAFAGDA